jgi:hypothetical protein
MVSNTKRKNFDVSFRKSTCLLDWNLLTISHPVSQFLTANRCWINYSGSYFGLYCNSWGLKWQRIAINILAWQGSKIYNRERLIRYSQPVHILARTHARKSVRKLQRFRCLNEQPLYRKVMVIRYSIILARVRARAQKRPKTPKIQLPKWATVVT